MYYGTINYTKKKLPDGSVNITRVPVPEDSFEEVIALPFMLWMIAFSLTCFFWTCPVMCEITIGSSSIWTHIVFPFTPWLCLGCWVIYPILYIITASVDDVDDGKPNVPSVNVDQMIDDNLINENLDFLNED